MSGLKSMDEQIDPISLEILWNRLIGVANEQAAALMRTSFTSVVRESGDLSAAVFDARGRMLAQAVTGTPGHINSLATSMKHFLAAFPVAELSPGDVLITNDPWKTSGQLNDFSVVTPVFHRKGLIGFLGNTCHAVDIGGRGLSADASEVFEEGLFVPMSKLYEQGRPNQLLLAIIAANVRAPAEVLGDLNAQVVGNDVGANRLVKYLDEFELADLEVLSDEILDRSERAVRQAITAVPDGDYTSVVHTDGIDQPIRIQCAIRIRGDEIAVDYAGSSEQVPQGMNVVLNYTAAYTNYGLKCAICPEVPHNEGSFRPVTITAPAGSILNPRFPAAVAARHIVGQFLPDAVFGALAEVLPQRIIAPGSGNIWLVTIRGSGQDRFTSVIFAAGGMGARPTADGLSATSFPSGIATTPVEVLESNAPLLVRRKVLRRDSGGPGKYRGGLGQEIAIEVRTREAFVVSALADRIKSAAPGRAGGLPGARGGFLIAGRPRSAKISASLPPGTGFTLQLPGGGGFGKPDGREPERIAEDIAEGLVSAREAAATYGFRPARRRVSARRVQGRRYL